MLEFSLHEIRVGSRFYILLPKLNRTQMQTLGAGLKRQGFAVGGDSSMKAKGRGAILHIDSGGLCWSNADPADWIVPAIPELLSAPKEEVPLEALKRQYFSLQTSGSTAILRFEPRIERGSLWRALRNSDQCGLSPDETAVLLFLLESAAGGCDLLTDFPTSTSLRRAIGGKLYFDSHLNLSEIRSTLRSAGRRSTRNSYLPWRGILRLAKFKNPPRGQYAELFEGLGEWCFLKPAQKA